MIFLQIISATIIIFIILENIISFDLKLQLKNIKNITKNILFERLNKTLDISQVGPKPSSYFDYPGLDIKKLHKNIKLWDLYYKCIEELQNNINNNIFQAKVITTLKSASLRLECELCISPKDLNHKNIWYYSWFGNSNKLTLVKENDYFRISSLDLSLTIINMDESKSGFYQCKLSNIEAGPYFIELINDDANVIDINNTNINYTINKNIVLKDLNLKMLNLWTEWSSCSKCDEMGKQIKFGHCVVSLKSTNSTTSQTNTKHNFMTNHKNEKQQFLKDLIYAFDTGLPCHSSLLDTLNNFNKIENQATLVMIKSCEVKCSNDIFEIKDIQGNVKEKVNNSAGIYSVLQIMPELPPKVETLVIITFLNEQLRITCPGNLNSNAPYEWRLNNKIISSKNKRISVDILNRLILKNVTKYDEQIFTCWQVNYLAGIVQIKIIKEFKISIHKDTYLYGIIFVLGIFLWIGVKMFLDREAVLL